MVEPIKPRLSRISLAKIAELRRRPWIPEAELKNPSEITAPRLMYVASEPKFAFSIYSFEEMTSGEFRRVKAALKVFGLEKHIQAEFEKSKPMDPNCAVGIIRLHPNTEGLEQQRLSPTERAEKLAETLQAFNDFAKVLFKRDDVRVKSLNAALAIIKAGEAPAEPGMPLLNENPKPHLSEVLGDTLFFHLDRQPEQFDTSSLLDLPGLVQTALKENGLEHNVSEITVEKRKREVTEDLNKGIRVVQRDEAANSVLHAINFWFNLTKHVEWLRKQARTNA